MSDPQTGKFYCVCCGYATLDEQAGTGTYEMCPVCDWEDDETQFKDPTYAGGANQNSLVTARKLYATIGASDKGALGRVKPPGPGIARNPAMK